MQVAYMHNVIWQTHMHMHLLGLLEHQWLICVCNMTDSYVCHYSFGLIHVWYDLFMRATWTTNMHMHLFGLLEHQWLICMCNMTDSYVCHYSGWFICVPWLIHMCSMTNAYAHTPFWIAWTPVTICMCNMTYSYVWHYSFGLIHMCGMMYSYMQHAKRTWTRTYLDFSRNPWFIRASWPIHICFIRATWPIHICFICAASWLIHICDMTNSDWFIRVTWLIQLHMQPFGFLEHQWFVCMCNMTDSY